MNFYSNKRKTCLQLAMATAGIAGLHLSTGRAATFYWTGGTTGVGQAWKTGANWSTSDGVYQSASTGLPTTGANVGVIDSSTATNGLVSADLGLSTSFSITSVTFGAGVAATEYIDDSTVANNTTAYNLTLNGDGNSAHDLITLNNGVTGEVDFRGAAVIGNTGGELLTMTFGGVGNLDVVNASAYLRIDAPITSTATSIAKTGAGSVTLAATNTFAAGSTFTVNSGTLNMIGSNTFTTTSGSTFTVAGGTANLSGTLTFGNGSTFNVSSGSANFSGAGTFGDTSTFNVTGGTATLSAGSFGNSGTFNVNGGSASISGGIFGNSVAFNVSSGTATLTGGTFGNGGTFTATGGTASIGSTTFGTGSTFNINGASVTLTGSNAIGTGSAFNINSGTLLFSSAVQLGATAGNVTTNIYGGALSYSGSTTALSSSRPFTVNSATSTINVVTGDTLNIGGIISGSGTLNKTGPGILILANTGNSYTAGTSVSAGSVSIAAPGDLGPASSTSGTLTLNGGTLTTGTISVSLESSRSVVLGANGGTLDTSATLTVAGILSGSGSLNLSGGGTIALTNAGNTFGSGPINIGAATLKFSNPADLGANASASVPTTINIGAGTLEFSGLNYTIANNLPLNLSSASSSIDVVNGATFTISNTSGYTNPIAGTGNLNKVDGGTLVVKVPTSVTAVNVAGGTLTIGNTSAIGTLPAAPATDVTLADQTTLAFIVGTTLNSTRNFAIGPTAMSSSGTSTIEVDPSSGGTFNYVGINGVISNNGLGTGGLTKTGADYLVLNGSDTYTGATNINAGTLAGSGTLTSLINVNSGGTIGAGATAVANSVTSPTVGKFTTTSGETWNAGGAYTWKLDLSNPGTPGTTTSGTPGTSYDELSMGTLGIAATSSSTFTIHLTGINAGSSSFDQTQNYTWPIAMTTAANGTANITGFDPTAFVLDTSNFGTAAAGTFSIVESPDGSGEDLVIDYTGTTSTPEPAMGSILVFASGLLLRRRSRNVVPHGVACP